MGDFERAVLGHYNLNHPFPEEWPAEKDVDDGSGDDDPKVSRTKAGALVRRSKSKYAHLDRQGSERRSVPGSERGGDGVENLVQKDEADPLGSSGSVVQLLRSKGLPVDDNAKLRNRFLLSSTSFSPTMFLAQVHAADSNQSLLDGLEFLSRSIDQKSASLKVLVESNFERFVRAKATIDNVYTEMRQQGAPAAQSKTKLGIGAHSRHGSRNSTHFRTTSAGGPLSPGLPPEGAPDRKKNALTKEAEYGVAGIKVPLIEVAVKAEEVWGPALGGRERESGLKAALAAVDNYTGVYEVSPSIADCIKRKDYEALVEEYGRARKFKEGAGIVVENAAHGGTSLSDAQIHQIIVTARMWLDVEDQIEGFKRDMWRRLVGIQPSTQSGGMGSAGQPEEHMELISILLELGVQDNPIWVWLLSRYDHLKSKIISTSERLKMQVEVLRRNLAVRTPPGPQLIASNLRASVHQGLKHKPECLDESEVIEMWDLTYSSLNLLLASSGGILGEVLEFCDTARAFIDGKTQRTLPVGFDGQSRQHHRLSSDGVRDLQSGASELVNLIRDNVFSFFADPPIEDISLLFSPLPQTPDTPRTPRTPHTPRSANLSPGAFQDPRFKFDQNNPPPPSPKLGESWEKFAFWPPYSNSLSGVYYLGKALVLIGTAASEMAGISGVNHETGNLERMKNFVGGTRERCVQAICAAWNRDAENCKVLEDWTKSNENTSLTKMPSHFRAFETGVLSGMQKVLYVSEAMTKAGSAEVVLPPPTKLLQMVRTQFVTSLYKAFSGMVSNAEKPVVLTTNHWDDDPDGIANPIAGNAKGIIIAHPINARDKGRRMLLTLANLMALRSDIVPGLISSFETLFSVTLTDESKTIHDVLGQIDARLFASVNRATVDKLSRTVREGIQDPSWAPKIGTRPAEVRPYVYEALLTLVLVHTQVSTTAPSLTSQILSHLLEQLSSLLLAAFKARGRFSLSALMQATLDVEFIAQTLSQYTSERASELQAQIYTELDRGTDEDARKRLQKELPEMRQVLRTLRETSRAEFACFKKQRPARDRPERQQA